LTPVRDFTYVKDTARGFLAVAESDAAVGQVTNIGTGTGVTMQQLVDQCCEIVGRRPTIAVDESRIRPELSEVMRLVCDNRKAATIAGWQPKYSLRDGLLETLPFVETHAHLFDTDRYAI